jgi:hypothetical protein
MADVVWLQTAAQRHSSSRPIVVPIPLFHVPIGGLGSVAKLQLNHVGKELVMFFESAGAELFGR